MYSTSLDINQSWRLHLHALQCNSSPFWYSHFKGEVSQPGHMVSRTGEGMCASKLFFFVGDYLFTQFMVAHGNAKVNAIMEANLPPGFRRPTDDASG